MLAIGGWNEGGKTYSAMASSAKSRAKFIDSVVAFLKEHSFDGFDLDWEYPGGNGSPPEDKQRFTSFVQVSIPYLAGDA